jgi:hypothetical protein
VGFVVALNSPPFLVLIVLVCLGGMCLKDVARRCHCRQRPSNEVCDREGEDCRRGRHSTAKRHGEAAQSVHKRLRPHGARVLPVAPRMFPSPNPSLAIRQKAQHNVQSRPAGGFNHGPHSIPCNLLMSLHALMWRSLDIIIGLDGSGTPFRYSGHNLPLLILVAATKVAALYRSVDNTSAPFFDLTREMDRHVLDQRGDLLSRHSRGCEGVQDVLNDIKQSRLAWTCKVLGSRAAVNYKFDKVTTRAGSGCSHERERAARWG